MDAPRVSRGVGTTTLTGGIPSEQDARGRGDNLMESPINAEQDARHARGASLTPSMTADGDRLDGLLDAQRDRVLISPCKSSIENYTAIMGLIRDFHQRRDWC